jgi:hypothetical protein
MFPAEMKIDYIRVYQDLSDPTHTLGCSPIGYPTDEYIRANNASFKTWQPVPAPPLNIYIITVLYLFFQTYSFEFLSIFSLLILFLVIARFVEKLLWQSTGYEEVPSFAKVQLQ